MSMLPRSVPIRYERDFWPSSYDRRMPIYHDSFPSYDYRYSTSMQPSMPMTTYRDPIPFEYERPLQETRVVPSSSVDHEMRRMNDEMKRMCDSMSRSVAVAPSQPPVLPSVDDWRLTENFRMDNPITQERDGSRKFYLEFDVAQFKPEEITVKTTGNQLSVHARHEDKNDPNRSAYREFARQYVIPKEVRPEFLTSKLSDRGKLIIEAPLPALTGGRDKLIPIEHRK